MADDIMPKESMTVISSESGHSPKAAPSPALALSLEVGNAPGPPNFALHGFFNLGVELTGRYSGTFPSPIFVAAVFRKTGQVYFERLINQDEIPPKYKGAGAKPAITRADGRSSAGISESGFFKVDLKSHLGLAGAEGVYDVFLWIEDLLSDMVSAEKSKDEVGGVGATRYKRSISTAKIESLPKGGHLTLSTELRANEMWFVGASDRGPVSVIAYVLKSQSPGWAVLGAKTESAGQKQVNAGGFSFAFKTSDLLPGIAPGDRILAVAVSDGRRTPLLDVTVSP